MNRSLRRSSSRNRRRHRPPRRVAGNVARVLHVDDVAPRKRRIVEQVAPVFWLKIDIVNYNRLLRVGRAALDSLCSRTCRG